MKTAYFQKDALGNLIDSFVYDSYMFYKSKGYTAITFEENNLPASYKGQPLYGYTDICEKMFNLYGTGLPSTFTYPKLDHVFYFRHMHTVNTVSSYNNAVNSLRGTINKPVFVKPDKVKLFTGQLIDSDFWQQHFIKYLQQSKLHVSEVVEFISEWRVFVYNGSIVDCRHYTGDPLKFPQAAWLGLLLDNLLELNKMPIAFTMDVGRLKTGSWVLVECNDMWATGSYGCDREKYVECYDSRWNEIMNIK